MLGAKKEGKQKSPPFPPFLSSDNRRIQAGLVSKRTSEIQEKLKRRKKEERREKGGRRGRVKRLLYLVEMPLDFPK